MKRVNGIIMFLAVLMLPSLLPAQNNAAEKLLDSAVAAIKADGGVRMDFAISMYDADGNKEYDDEGVLKMQGEKYSLLTDQMKLWCDGSTQWSYITQNNEIYISEPNADDVRAFSPVHIMELYKNGFRSAVDKNASTPSLNAVVLTAMARGSEFKKVSLLLDKNTNRPARMCVYYDNGMWADIEVVSYKANCKFQTKEFRCRVKDFRGAEVVDMR